MGELRSALDRAVSGIGQDLSTYSIRLQKELPDGSVTSGAAALDDIDVLFSVPRHLTFSRIDPQLRLANQVIIFPGLPGSFFVSFSSYVPRDINLFFSAIQQELGLELFSTESGGSGFESRVVGDPGVAEAGRSLDLPQKVTIRWLTDHVPLPFWLTGMSALIVAFVLGVYVGQTDFARQLLHGLEMFNASGTPPE
ncbi:MAG: hypothetical protein R3F16_22860 [Myxococcota bacterium]